MAEERNTPSPNLVESAINMLTMGNVEGNPAMNMLTMGNAEESPTMNMMTMGDAEENPAINMLTMGNAEEDLAITMLTMSNAEENSAMNILATGNAEESPAKNMLKMGNAEENPALNILPMGNAEENLAINMMTMGNTEENPAINMLTMSNAEENPALNILPMGNAEENAAMSMMMTGKAKENPAINILATGNAEESPAINMLTMGNVKENPAINMLTMGNAEENLALNMLMTGNAEEDLAINMLTIGNAEGNASLNMLTMDNAEENPGMNMLTMGNPEEDLAMSMMMTGNAEENPVINMLTMDNAEGNPSLNMLTMANAEEDLAMNMLTIDNAEGNPAVNKLTMGNPEENPEENPALDTPMMDNAEENPAINMLTVGNGEENPAINTPTIGNTEENPAMPTMGNIEENTAINILTMGNVEENPSPISGSLLTRSDTSMSESLLQDVKKDPNNCCCCYENCSHEQDSCCMKTEPDRIATSESGECPTCPQCVRQFTHVDHLNAHMVTHEEDNEQRELNMLVMTYMEELAPNSTAWYECHTCYICIEGFTYQHQLTTHMMTHTQQDPPMMEVGSETDSCWMQQEDDKYLTHGKSFKNRSGSLTTRTKPIESKMKMGSNAQTKERQRLNSGVEKRQYRKHETTQPGESDCHACSICGQGFPDQQQLKQHALIHAGEKPHRCSVCKKLFPQLAYFQQHMKLHAVGKPQRLSVQRQGFLNLEWRTQHLGRTTDYCVLCSKGFRSPGDMKRHLWSHTGEKPYKCSRCNKGFTRNHRLQRHLEMHPKEKPHKCSVCNKRFIYSESLDKHLMTHTGEKPHQCSVCSKMFSRPYTLRRHVMTHTQEERNEHSSRTVTQSKCLTAQTQDKSYKCTVCNQQFSRWSDLKIHNNLHRAAKLNRSSAITKRYGPIKNLQVRVKKGPGVKAYKCPVCDKMCRWLRHFREHMMTHIDEKPHQCSVCSKRFSVKGSLNRHMLDHTGEKPHQCSMCNTRFNLSSDLKRHKRIHTGEKPHKCSVCSQMFTQIGNLNAHMRTHTGEKPHQCSVCSKSFPRSRSLKKHMTTHSGKKPHQCSVCSRKFPFPRNLQRHMSSHKQRLDTHSITDDSVTQSRIKVHADEKSPQCSVCSKTFTLAKDLQRHMMKHSGEKPHKCSICRKEFSRPDYLQRHMQVHSGEITDKKSVHGNHITRGRKLRQQNVQTRKYPHQCSLCSKRFSQLSILQSHMRQHTQKQLDKDSVDDDSGTQSSNLHLNTNVNTVESPLESVHLDNFQEPVLKPEEEKPHQCTVCSRIFSFPRNLQRHMSSHRQRHRKTLSVNANRSKNLGKPTIVGTEPQRYVTQHTQEQFDNDSVDDNGSVQSWNSDPHTNTNMEERSQDSSLHLDSLEKRVLKDEEEKPHQCTVCGRKFSFPRNLQRHMSSHKQRPRKTLSVNANRLTQSKNLRQRTTGGTKPQRYMMQNTSKLIDGVPVEDDSSTHSWISQQHTNINPEQRPQASPVHMDCLKQPVSKPEKEKPHQCLVCNRRFSLLLHLQCHMSSHKQRRRKTYPVNAKRLRQSKNLSQPTTVNTENETPHHMMPHTQEELDNSSAHDGRKLQQLAAKAAKYPHQCAVCSKRFSQPHHLERHMLIHTGEKPHQCSVCSKTFNRSDSLRKHMNIHLREKSVSDNNLTASRQLRQHRVPPVRYRHECSLCSKSFSQLSTLQRHMTLHKQGTARIHTVSDNKVTRSNNVHRDTNVHSEAQTSNSSAQCGSLQEDALEPSLEEPSVHLDNLEQPILKPEKEKPHQCSVCGRRFSFPSNLQRHKSSHKGRLRTTYPVIANRLRQSRNISQPKTVNTKSQMMQNTQEELDGCSVDDASSTWSLQQLTNINTDTVPHEPSVHSDNSQEPVLKPEEEKPHQCSVCSRRFSFPRNLQRHMSSHKQRPRKTYSVSDKGFGRSNTLCQPSTVNTKPEHHSIRHTQEQFDEHSVVNDSSTQSKNLHPRTRINMEERQQETRSAVNNRFRQSRNVHQPTIVNRRMKPQCTVCSKIFTRLKDLKRHMLTHTGEKPHQCSVCGEGFTRRYLLQSHLTTHVAEENNSHPARDKRGTHSNNLKVNPDEKAHEQEIVRTDKNVQQDMKDPSEPQSPESAVSLDRLWENGLEPTEERPQHHLMQNTQEEPDDYSVDGDSSVQSWDIQQHTNVNNTEERPQESSVCLDSLPKPVLKPEEEKPHPCSVCSRRFSFPRNLQRHMSSHKQMRRNTVGKNGFRPSKTLSQPSTVNRKHEHHLIQNTQFDNQSMQHTLQQFDDHSVDDDSGRQSWNLHPRTNVNMEERQQETSSAINNRFRQTRNLHQPIIVNTGIKPQKCSVCSKTFTLLEDLKSHMLTHTGEKPHRCLFCGEEFTQSYVLQFHVLTHTGEKLHQCPVCGERFTQSYVLQFHLATHIEYNEYARDKRSTPSNNLKVHPEEKAHEQEAVRMDKNVQEVLKVPTETPEWSERLHRLWDNTLEHTEKRIQRQMMQYTQEEVYNHLVDDYSRTQSWKLQQHTNADIKEKPQDSSLHLDSLQEHVVKPELEKPHKCSVCSRTFSFPRNLQRHMSSHKGRRRKTYSASNTRSMTVNTTPEQHMVQNTQEELDGHSVDDASSTWSLQQLTNVNTETRPQESSVHLDSLHEPVIPEVEKPHKCSADDINSTESRDLPYSRTSKPQIQECSIRLERLQTPPLRPEQKPHQCSVCNKKFTRFNIFQRHMMRHTRANLDQHPVADNSQVKSRSLRHRKLINTEDKPHQCSVCNKRFTQLHIFERHMLCHRRGNPKKHSARHDSDRLSKNSHQSTKINTNQKPHKCPVCYKRFVYPAVLRKHMARHKVVKPNTGSRIVKRHQCTECSKAYSRIDTLRQHMMIHTAKKSHECSICSKEFSLKGTLDRHMMIHAGEKPHRCSVCNKRFSLKGTLNRHMMTHKGEKPHQCSMCSKGFRLLSQLNHHMKTHTGENPHQCSVCSKRFSLKMTLDRHMLSHTGEKPHQCSVCHKSYSRNDTLREHMMIHNAKKSHTCSICNKWFHYANRLLSHMATHEQDKPRQCSVCSKKFTLLVELNQHMKTHTGEKPHQCSVCSKRFSLKGTLDRHMKIHTGEKPHQCSVCSKMFSLSKDLRRHMVMHTGETAHRCSVCTKSFTRADKLQQHMLRHVGKKPHKCSVCKKRFNRLDTLQKHEMTHTGEKPHQCSVCNKRFTRFDKLQQHMLLHSGRKPHKCSECGKKFSRSDKLSQHLKTHTGEKPHRCSVCRKSFLRSDKLSKHMNTHKGH